MSLSDQIKGWTSFEADGFTHSYWKASKCGTMKAIVHSLSTPGDWYVETQDFGSGIKHTTPCDQEECFKSLIEALAYADGCLNEHERLQ